MKFKFDQDFSLLLQQEVYPPPPKELSRPLCDDYGPQIRRKENRKWQKDDEREKQLLHQPEQHLRRWKEGENEEGILSSLLAGSQINSFTQVILQRWNTFICPSTGLNPLHPVWVLGAQAHSKFPLLQPLATFSPYFHPMGIEFYTLPLYFWLLVRETSLLVASQIWLLGRCRFESHITKWGWLLRWLVWMKISGWKENRDRPGNSGTIALLL